MSIIAGFVFTNDHQTGVAPLIRSTKNGRLRITVIKVVVVYGSAVLLCLLFCGETLFVINATTGFSSTASPIQILSRLLYCPYIVSIREYLVIDFGFKLIVAFIFTAISAAISTGFKSYLLTYIGSLGLLGADYLFFIIKFPSGENFMRAVNLMSASVSQTILDRYRAVRFGDTPITYISVILIAFTIVLALSTTFVIIKYSRGNTLKHVKTMNGVNVNRKPLTAIKKRDNSHPAKREFSMSIFIAELCKSTMASKLIYVIAALLIVKSLIVYTDFQSTTSFADEAYHNYMSELSGPINEEKRAYVLNERKFIMDTINIYDMMSESYVNDEISLEDYRDYLSDYNYAFGHDEVLARIESHVSYIDIMSTEGKEAWFVYDTGWQRLLTRGFDWSLYALVIILCSNIFAAEYNSQSSSAGFHIILRTTKQGRRKTFNHKLGTAVLLSFVFSLIWCVVDLVVVMMKYELPVFNAPIWSIEYFSEVEYIISIGQFVILSLCIKILAHMILAILTTALSLILRKNISAMIFITMLTLLPRVLSTLGMSALKRVDYVDFMESTAVLLKNEEGAVFTIVVAISSICVALLSKRIWSK